MFRSNESKLPHQEDGWDIFITENLKKLNLINHDKIWIDRKAKPFSSAPENFLSSLTQPNHINPIVSLDQFKIQKVETVDDKEKLSTKNLSSCYALAAQIYQENKLSNIGLVHCMSDLDVSRQFFQEIIKVTNNKYDYINLFICGGCNNTFVIDNMENAIKAAVKNIRDVRLVHDVSKQLYKRVKVVHEDTIYRGDLVIKEVGFDDSLRPRICIDIQIEGLNLEKLFSSSSKNIIKCGFY